MRNILLSTGNATMVDDDIFDLVKDLKWHEFSAGKKTKVSYAIHSLPRGFVPYREMRLHHFVAGYPLHGKVIDHIDGNGLNNLRSNLRVVSRRQNSCNRWEKRNNKTSSKYSGVSFCKRTGKWAVFASLNGRNKFFGRFSDEKKAANTYEQVVSSLL